MKKSGWNIIGVWCLVLFWMALVSPLAAQQGFSDPWEKLRDGGFILLIRHAVAPGTGDPPNFDVNDCATQRNLSEEGREQSRAMGKAFKREKVPILNVFSSQWCRCRDTARLAFGSYEVFPPINSFFPKPEQEAQQTADTMEYLRQQNLSGGNLILVTHQVNITALTGVFPRQGEIIVTRLNVDGQLDMIERFLP